MNRLTMHGKDYCEDCGAYDGAGCGAKWMHGENDCFAKRLYDRLASYEDTGLEPEDVAMLATSPYLAYGKVDPETVEKTLDKMAEGAPGQIMLAADIGNVSVWIPTGTLLPNVGEPVLIARKIRHNETVLVEPAVLRPDGTWKAIGHKIKPSSVRHWMPMPEPPKEGIE